MNLAQIIAALQQDVTDIKNLVAGKDAQIAQLTADLATAQANAVSQADLDSLTQVDTDLKAVVSPPVV